MKLCIIVPSADYLKQAGVRIRYDRLRAPLAERGVTLQVKVVDDITFPELRECDVYIFSKLLDVRSIMLAREVAAGGRVIGIDLFDDYFSQTDDSRFVRLREWGRTIAPMVHFVLCSTPRMASVGASMVPGVPCVIMNDPCAPFDPVRLGARIEHKLEQCWIERTIRLGWFGIGDNPHFPVGLADLAAFGGRLATLAGAEFDVELEIMTNRRALTVERIETLRRLAVPYRIYEWSAAGESALIDRTFACFLPVNGQLFSMAKSLNRAVSTLTGGAQVLTSGYPLYEPLADFTYTSPEALLGSIRDGEPLLRRDTLPAFSRMMDELALPAAEADRVVVALTDLVERHLAKPRKRPKLAVLHGHRHSESAHKLAQRLGHISAASPLCLGKLRHDVRFTITSTRGSLEARLSTKAQRRMAADVATPRDGEGVPIGAQAFAVRGLSPALQRLRGYRAGTLGARIAFFDTIMASCTQALGALFPDAEVLIAEHEAPLYSIVAPPALLSPVVQPPAIIAVPNGYDKRPESEFGALRYAIGTALAGSIVISERDLRRHGVALGRGEPAERIDEALGDQRPGAIVVANYSGRIVKELLTVADRRALPVIALVDRAMLDSTDPDQPDADPSALKRRAAATKLLLNRADTILCDSAATAERVTTLFRSAPPATILPEDDAAAAIVDAITAIAKQCSGRPANQAKQA